MSTVTTPKPTLDHSQEFEALFRDHYLLVYRTACVITGSPEDAEDVLQTIFLRLMRRAAPPDVRKNPKGYFYKAAVHLSLDTIRSRQKETDPQCDTVKDDLGRKLRTLPVRLRVQLTNLPVGAYDCEVTVLDPATKKSVVWRSAITVVN